MTGIKSFLQKLHTYTVIPPTANGDHTISLLQL